jgi:hypothetical protein
MGILPVPVSIPVTGTRYLNVKKKEHTNPAVPFDPAFNDVADTCTGINLFTSRLPVLSDHIEYSVQGYRYFIPTVLIKESFFTQIFK